MVYLEGFNLEDRGIIVRVIGEWNYALNGGIILQLVDKECNNCWYIIKLDSGCQMVIDFDRSHEYETLAWANEVGGDRIYVIRDRLSLDSEAGVIRHEIGHLLGAVHAGRRLMTPTYDYGRYICIDKLTTDMVSVYMGIEGMNYCIE
jgi:hypothetical protein